MPGAIRIGVLVPTERQALVAALELLCALNLLYLKSHPKSPLLFDSGIRYKREPRGVESWQTYEQMLVSKQGDCEDLASARVAEIRFRGLYAEPWPVCNNRLWHVYVKTSKGLEDPSKRLGM